MKIFRQRSLNKPQECHMVVKGLFGKVIAEVKYSTGYIIHSLDDRPGYFIIKNGVMIGACTNFDHAVDACLTDLGVIIDTIV